MNMRLLSKPDKGVALLLSIVMLAIFLTMGIAFILFSGSIRQSSEIRRMNTAALTLTDHVMEEMRVMMENTFCPVPHFDSIPSGYKPYNVGHNGAMVEVTTNWESPMVSGQLEDSSGAQIEVPNYDPVAGWNNDVRYAGRPTNISSYAIDAATIKSSVKSALSFNYADGVVATLSDPEVGWVSAAVDAPTRVSNDGGFYYYTYAVMALDNQYSPNLFGPEKTGSTDTRLHGVSPLEVPINHLYGTEPSLGYETLRNTSWESLQHLRSELDDDTTASVFFTEIVPEGAVDDSTLALYPWDQSNPIRKYLYDGRFGIDNQGWGSSTTAHTPPKVLAYQNALAASKYFDLSTATACPNNLLEYHSGTSTEIYGRLRYLRMPAKSASADTDDNAMNADPAGVCAGHSNNLDPRVCSAAVYANINDFLDADSIPTTFDPKTITPSSGYTSTGANNLKDLYTNLQANSFNWTLSGAYDSGVNRQFYSSTTGTDFGALTANCYDYAKGFENFQAYTVGLEATPYFRQLNVSLQNSTPAIAGLDATDPGQLPKFTMNIGLETAMMYPQAAGSGSYTAKIKVFYSFKYVNSFGAATPIWDSYACGMVETSTAISNSLGLSSVSMAIPESSVPVQRLAGNGNIYHTELRDWQSIAVVIIEDASGNMVDWSCTPPVRHRSPNTAQQLWVQQTNGCFDEAMPDVHSPGAFYQPIISSAGQTLSFDWEAVDPRCNNALFRPWDLEQTGNYRSCLHVDIARFGMWLVNVKRAGASVFNAVGWEQSALGTDPRIKPWAHLAGVSNTIRNLTTYGGAYAPNYPRSNTNVNFPAINASMNTAAKVTTDDANGIYHRPKKGFYHTYQGLLIDVEPYMLASQRGLSGSDSWTAKLSTSYIKNGPFGSFKELGLIGRGECFRTLNLTKRGYPADCASDSTAYTDWGPYIDTFRISSGRVDGCNDMTLLHYLKFNTVYDDTNSIQANLLSAYERNPSVISAYMRDCYGANPQFNDPRYGSGDTNGRVPDDIANNIYNYFPVHWSDTAGAQKWLGSDSFNRFHHLYNIRHPKAGQWMFYRGCPGLGAIMEIAQTDTMGTAANHASGGLTPYDSQAEGIFCSNYRLVGPGHRYFMAVVNVRHSTARVNATTGQPTNFDPRDYDMQAKMVVIFERVMPAIDTAPITSRIISKQIIME